MTNESHNSPATSPPRYSLFEVMPQQSGNSRAIASLAVQHLMGEELDTEKANHAAYWYGAEEVTSDQLIEQAKKMAESEVGKAASRALKSANPNRAKEMIANHAENEAHIAERLGLNNGLRSKYSGRQFVYPEPEPADPFIFFKNTFSLIKILISLVIAVPMGMWYVARHIVTFVKVPKPIPPIFQRPITVGIALLAFLVLLIATRIPNPAFWWIITAAFGLAFSWYIVYAIRKAQLTETPAPSETTTPLNSSPSVNSPAAPSTTSGKG